MKNSIPNRKKVVALLCFVVSVPLWFVTTNRDFINLQPSEGMANSVALKSDETYEQVFIATRSTITQIGLFIHPASAIVPSGNVVIRVLKDNALLAEEKIPSEFIDAEGASYANFTDPINVQRRSSLRIQISVPKELDGMLRLQQRIPDNTFDPTNVQFIHDGEILPQPLAYQVYYQYRPPLALQLAGLLTLAAQQILFPLPIIYILTMAFLFMLPSVLLGTFSVAILLHTVFALAGMILLLRTDRASWLSTLTGAHVFAFTTWLPLHALGGREYYAVVALLPLVVLLAQKGKLSLRMWSAVSLTLISFTVALLTFTDGKSRSSPTFTSAHPRDVFVDPNQVPTSHKTFFYPSYGVYPKQIEEWDHYGSYVGIMNIMLAAVGLAWRGFKNKGIVLVGVLGALIALTPHISITLQPILPLSPQHFVILTTFSLAFFTAWGIQALQTYFGNNRITTVVIAAITVITLLDLWHVAATTLEFSYI